MTDLSSGDADLRVRLDVKGNDELAVIGNGFNAFVSKIHTVLLQVHAERGQCGHLERRNCARQ
ncbi:HAMP domain-containing protein [Massilia sp. B-10]|nr:HAMP domain-containing protein [Massilia sp. B-10]